MAGSSTVTQALKPPPPVPCARAAAVYDPWLPAGWDRTPNDAAVIVAVEVILYVTESLSLKRLDGGAVAKTKRLSHLPWPSAY